MCKKLIKNSKPFGKKFLKTTGFFDSHCTNPRFTYFLTCSYATPTGTMQFLTIPAPVWSVNAPLMHH